MSVQAGEAALQDGEAAIGTGSVDPVPSTKAEQTITFADQTPGFDYGVAEGFDPSFQTETANLDLNKWMARPRVIARFEWDANDVGSFNSFDPWTALWAQTADKWSGFARMRHKLHLKVQINGNGFYMGRLLASYNPNGDLAGFVPSRALIGVDAIRESQRPHLWIDPTTSTGGEMTIPFHYPQPFYNTRDISDTPGGNTVIGSFLFRVISPLKHANLDPLDTKVNLTVYAWASEIMLDSPTDWQQGKDVRLKPQAGDEYGTGVVSRPANILSRMAKSVMDVPVIGRYAFATHTIASSVSSIASRFGFSRPTIVTDPVRVFQHFVGDLATTVGSDPVHRLTLDPKQEVTLDPSTLGLSGVDEMALDHIAGIESYYSQFAWSAADGVGDTIVEIPVHPMALGVFGTGPTAEYHLSALAAATLPFAMWRGSIKYRFQIVSTAFHKGRLTLSWDLETSTGEPDVVQQVVVDIGEHRDFEICVGHANPRNYIRTLQPLPSAASNQPSSGTVTANDETYNGVLSLRVHTPLTVPTDAVDSVTVLISVSAGDDFELANPADANIRGITFYSPQAGADEYNSTPGEPGKPSVSFCFNRTKSPPAAAIHHGDPAYSLRQLAKRYALHDNIVLPDVGEALWQKTLSNFPAYRGRNFADQSTTKDGVGYKFGNNSILTIYTPAYLGWRGSIRWKVQAIIENRINAISAVRLPFATSEGAGVFEPYVDKSLTDTGTEAMLASRQVSGIAGQTSTVAWFPVLHFDLPYHSTNLYQETISTPQFAPVNNFHRLSVNVRGGTPRNIMTRYVAIGEDFNLFFFKGMPPVFHNLETYPSTP